MHLQKKTIIYLGIFFLLSLSCRTKDKRKRQELREVKDKNLNMKIIKTDDALILKSLKIEKVDAKLLQIIDTELKLEKIKGNEYPKITVSKSKTAEFVVYKLCHKQNCVNGYEYKDSFLIKGLSRIKYKQEDLLDLTLIPCVDPQHALLKKENCGKAVHLKNQSLGKITNPKLDRLLAQIAEKRQTIQKNGMSLFSLVDSFLSQQDKSHDQEKNHLSLLQKLGGFQIGQQFLESRQNCVNEKMYLAGLHEESNINDPKNTLATTSSTDAQVKSSSSSFSNTLTRESGSGCFTIEEWNKLSDDERCRINQAMFFNVKDPYDCGLGQWYSGSANNPKWFFARKGYICSNTDNCYIYPKKKSCRFFQANFGKGSCKCDETPYYQDDVTDFMQNFNFRSGVIDKMNTFNQCVSEGQIKVLLEHNKSCLEKEKFESVQSKLETGKKIGTAGIALLGVGGIFIMGGLSGLSDNSYRHERSQDDFGGKMALLGLGSVVVGGVLGIVGLVLQNKAQSDLMLLAGGEGFQAKVNNLCTKNTKDLLKLRISEKKYAQYKRSLP